VLLLPTETAAATSSTLTAAQLPVSPSVSVNATADASNADIEVNNFCIMVVCDVQGAQQQAPSQQEQELELIARPCKEG
jgi:hypothetical protein